jgi:hypothetical protein
MLRLAAALLAVALATPAARAQAPPPDAPRVRDLLVLLDGPDLPSAQGAAADLVRIGPSAGPAVVDFLRTRTTCRARWLASSVLARLAIEPALVENTWLSIADGDCAARRPQDVLMRQEAALAVVDRPRGIDVMTRLLRGRDPAGRERAIRALQRLVERLSPGHAETIESTSGIAAAMGDALAALGRTVESREPLETRCAALDALRRAGELPHPASQTTALLLANLPQAKPYLVARLGETRRCRGLALVAGLLASDPPGPADVDAAHVRVLEGKCEGREPFDLLLAQNVADAFMRDAAGVVRVAALLSHPDLDVRRRAARAFATAFERLGPGEHGSVAGPADPSTIATLQASLAPLVTLAQQERDEGARCQAVRALLFAQQAVDDRLRAEAVAATAGRTLRCLAPPAP